MSWAKVDDQWFAHRKVVGTSLAARGLWATTLSWTCAHRTPEVPSHMVRFLAGDFAEEFADELVHSGLWHKAGHDCQECADVDDGWVIHNWDQYQERDLSEVRAEAGRKGGKRSGEARRKQREEPKDPPPPPPPEATPEANGKQTPVGSETNGEAGTRPGPTRPYQNTLAGASTDETEPIPSLEDFWVSYPRHHDNHQPGGGGAKADTKKRWDRLTPDEKRACLVAVVRYRADCENRKAFVKNAETWLNKRCWEDWLAAPPTPDEAEVIV